MEYTPGKAANSKNPISERRTDAYTFTSEKDLIAFFSGSLPVRLVKDTIKAVKAEFIERKLGTGREHRLQFLKKCEVELVKLANAEHGPSPGRMGDRRHPALAPGAA